MLPPSVLRTVRRPLAALALAPALVLPLAAPAVAQQPAAPAPPRAERIARIDTLHGEVRNDHYFWLREKTNPKVAQYLEAENEYARATLKHTEALQERLYNEMLGRIKQTDLSVPYQYRGYWYYTRTEEGKQYPIYARKRGSLDAPEQVLLDLNEMAKGQTFMGLGAFTVSDDGNLLAYSYDSTGFREYRLRVKDLRTGQLLPDAVGRTVAVAWGGDGKTLFYTTQDHAKRPYRLYRHVLGATGEDELVYEEKDEMFSVWIGRTRSGEWLQLSVGSLTTSEEHVLEASNPGGRFRMVAPRIPGQEYYVEHRGDRFWILTNDAGRNFRLVTAPVADPRRENWTEVIAHRPDVLLANVDIFRDFHVVHERRNALNEMHVVDARTGTRRSITFPEPVYAAGGSTNREWDATTYRYNYQSMVTPSSVLEYDVRTGESRVLKETEVLGGYDKSRYVAERVWAPARDGTRVPVSIVYRRGTPRDGTAPMLLYAYGSYGSSSSATFSSNRLSLLDRGFVYALAHIRGGGDMGTPWHDDGKMMKKMNTFTDFIDVAEHLIAERWTSKDRLVIEGGSAGGLLMGAVTNMRPDLFKAVVSHVPFVDVVNTMLDTSLPLTVGEFEEWGNPAKKDEYLYIRQYDPYGNIGAKHYPMMLVKTSFNDSQVMYHEPAKYVAKMRAMKLDSNPLLLVTNMGAGHGGASGRYDRLREIALDYAFMLWAVGQTEAVAP